MSQLRNAQFFLFLFLRYFSPRSAFSADCRSKSSVKQKQTLNKMRSEGSWTSTKRRVLCSLLFEFGLVRCVYFFDFCVRNFSAIFMYTWVWIGCVFVCVCVHVNVFTFIVFSMVVSSWGYFSPPFFSHCRLSLELTPKEHTVYYLVSNFRIYTEPYMQSDFELNVCVPTKSTWQMAWVRVFFRHDDVFFTTIKLEATFYFAHCCCGCWCSWYYLSMGLFFLILFACANIERERARAQAQ